MDLRPAVDAGHRVIADASEHSQTVLLVVWACSTAELFAWAACMVGK